MPYALGELAGSRRTLLQRAAGGRKMKIMVAIFTDTSEYAPPALTSARQAGVPILDSPTAEGWKAELT